MSSGIDKGHSNVFSYSLQNTTDYYTAVFPIGGKISLSNGKIIGLYILYFVSTASTFIVFEDTL